MIRKNWFYFCLLFLYLLFLSKDTILGVFSGKEEIMNTVCQIENDNEFLEYQNLLQLTQLEKQKIGVTYSKVLFRNIYEFYDSFVINKGSNHDIKVGDMVINQDGLIGSVSKVYLNTSEVLLLTHPSTNLSIKVGNAYGILYADNHTLKVKNIKLGSDIHEGDKVVTSGLTFVPSNIYIGTVKKVFQDQLELEYLLDVEYPLKDIRYVGVISV